MDESEPHSAHIKVDVGLSPMAPRTSSPRRRERAGRPWIGLLLGVTLAALALPLPAAVIGTNSSAQPLTAKRVAALPSALQPAWTKYLERSASQREKDKAVLREEARAHGLQQFLIPPGGAGPRRRLPLNRPAEWYGEAEALRLAGVVISFQTPAGGWSKNLDLTGNARAPGMHFAPDNSSRFAGNSDQDAPVDASWSYVGTFDNDATVQQLRFLAKVTAAAGKSRARAPRASFLRGLDYVLAAQYPNGGWPQVWPLQGGYHDAITYNDGAMINVLGLLRDVAAATNEFAFVPPRTRRRAGAALDRGVACIVATQIVTDGRRTVWSQQHDPLTLQPCPARNFEMTSACSAESAGIMMFLMQLQKPSADVVGAVHAAAAWFEKSQLRDVAYRFVEGSGRRLVAAAGDGPLWGRFHDIVTDRPLFGDRDKTIHDRVDEISSERQRGYQWYVETPRGALETYAIWQQSHPLPRRAE